MDFCLSTAPRLQLNPEANILLICFKGMVAWEVPARVEGQSWGLQNVCKAGCVAGGRPDNECPCVCDPV